MQDMILVGHVLWGEKKKGRNTVEKWSGGDWKLQRKRQGTEYAFGSNGQDGGGVLPNGGLSAAAML